MTVKAATAALMRLVSDIPQIVSLERIDRVWVFPVRFVGETESGLAVLALLPEGDPASDLREVVTVQYEERSGKGAPPPVREVTGRGWAPSAMVPQLIAGVVRRLGGEEEEPLTTAIGGETERWTRLVERVSGVVVDPANGE